MTEKINNAIEFMKQWHKNDFRKDGVTPYWTHPLDVFNLLKKCDKDNELEELYYIVALLHDVLEDTKCSEEEIAKEFGTNVAYLVNCISFYEDKNNPFAKAGYIADIAFHQETTAVFTVKIADRICNVKDFIKNGDYRYAKTYFHKADVLFDCLYRQTHKPWMRFKSTHLKLLDEVMDLYNQFHARRNDYGSR